jgi:predicted DNA-binding transcriptional regulator AlpA
VQNEIYGELLTVDAAADLIGIPVSTLESWRRLRIGPPAVRVGRAVAWRQLSVAAWIADGGALEYGIDLPPVRDRMGDDLRVPRRVSGPGQSVTA